jgi:hypothetical protein
VRFGQEWESWEGRTSEGPFLEHKLAKAACNLESRQVRTEPAAGEEDLRIRPAEVELHTAALVEAVPVEVHPVVSSQFVFNTGLKTFACCLCHTMKERDEKY